VDIVSRARPGRTARLLPILKARARTHLLANTLSLIASLLRRRPSAAEDLLAHLGRSLHESVAGPRPLVPLAAEVESALSFFGLERARLGGRLRLEVACADDALRVPVPSVIVQPLVENAIRHGVALKPEGGVVRIRARVGPEHLHLVVSDDGAGWRRGAQGTRESGWGVMGVRMRLAALCGNRARLRVWSRPDHGTIAAVTVPLWYAGSTRSGSRTRSGRSVPVRWH
jgi:two-component system, LytTR family, sensor kinase